MNSFVKQSNNLAGRFHAIRSDRFGDDDDAIESLAGALGLPPATWRNFERGVAMPAEVLLKLIETTRANPHWLLTGEGDRYSPDLGSRFSGEH